LTIHTWGRFSILSDPMIEVILVIYFNYSNPAFTPLQKRPFQLAKNAEKIHYFDVDF